jgi:hypothetical protein
MFSRQILAETKSASFEKDWGKIPFLYVHQQCGTLYLKVLENALTLMLLKQV